MIVVDTATNRNLHTHTHFISNNKMKLLYLVLSCTVLLETII